MQRGVPLVAAQRDSGLTVDSLSQDRVPAQPRGFLGPPNQGVPRAGRDPHKILRGSSISLLESGEFWGG